MSGLDEKTERIPAVLRDPGPQPLNGLRHPPEGDTTGWYIWAGEELSAAADFFEPLHVSHLVERCPAVLRFLGLGPGWRFLATGDQVEVWEDRALLIDGSGIQ